MPATGLSFPLRGTYTATVEAPFIGPISAQLTAEPTPGGFRASSRPDVAWSMVGGLEGFLGQIFANSIFPDGVILTWTSSAPEGDKPGEGSIGIGGLKSAHVTTLIRTPDAPIDILAPDGHKVAVLTLRPSTPEAPPLADYPALAAAVRGAIASRLYDPGLVDSWQLRGYLSQLNRNARMARDDVEFIFGAAIAAKNNIRFSLPLVIRRANQDTAHAFPNPDPQGATVRALIDQRTGIATLRADAFIDPGDVDRAFEKILAADPPVHGLIIDLHSCPGVTLASLRIASWLYDHPVDAGFFFGPSRRKDALAGRVDAFPRATIDSPASVAAAEHLLDTADAAAVVVAPEHTTYRGPVAVLVSRRTTTSAEPLAWLLQATGRARLFGSPTAGKPMLSRPIDIGQGWDLWLAAADYLPAGGAGQPSSDRAVRPLAADTTTSKETAKRYARRYLHDEAQQADDDE